MSTEPDLKTKEDWLRQEIRASRTLATSLLQWGITVLAAVELNLYYVRRDVMKHLLDAGKLTSLDADFCIEAVGNITERKQCEIFNTDQGAQFTTPRFTQPLLDKGIKVSMDGRGRALDNIFVERLWRTVKYEHVYLQDIQSVQEAWLGLRDFFNFYNHERFHQSLDYRTPADVYFGKRPEKTEMTTFYQPASILIPWGFGLDNGEYLKLPGIIVCMEATGVYHFDLAIALHDAGVSVMVINPKAAHNFAKVLMKNSKTDAVDADTLAEYAARMDFVAWVRPSDEAIVLRSFSRRITSLTDQKAAAKNHLHALTATQWTPKAVLNDAKLAIIQLQKRIDSLTAAALILIGKHTLFIRVLALLTGIKGIANTSAISLMGELLLLPPDLSHREWVKFAGLDPKSFDSGKSVHKKTRISKAGNRFIRAALYMPALSAKQHDPHVKAYFQHLVVDNGKEKMQAVCVVMRKLLHAIHGMLKHDKPFDNARFYAIPASAV